VPTLTEQLVAAAGENTRLTPELQGAAIRRLFDFAACARAGWPEPRDWPAGRAARLALAAHRFDQDDLHLRSVTHPGGVVWSAVAECGDAATIDEAIAAAAFGYELVVRLAEALGAAHRRLWHSTATTGTVGAAGAAALLLGADPVAAVGHALSVAGGSSQAIVERSSTRFVHRAHAASSGVACARAAASGLESSRLGLEGGRGAFAAAAGDPEVADGLCAPRAIAIVETGSRLYAANGFAHSSIDAALAMGTVAPAGIATVRVTLSPDWSVAIASAPAPEDDDAAWWSTEHAVAVCLATGDPDSLGRLSTTDEVLDLCRRVEVVPGGSSWSSSVEVELRDGTARSAVAAGPKGHGVAAATDDDLLRKWWRLNGDDGTALLGSLLAAGGSEQFGEFAGRLLPVD
jgi:2-methylcitrate dehydratase PrpD